MRREESESPTSDKSGRGSERIPVSDRERTVADALADPGWFGGIRHFVEILRTYRESKEWNPNRLLRSLGEIGSGASFKRLGYLAETVLTPEPSLVLEALARRTSGGVKLDPAIAERGRINTLGALCERATRRQLPRRMIRKQDILDRAKEW